jgi:hypothetical protein
LKRCFYCLAVVVLMFVAAPARAQGAMVLGQESSLTDSYPWLHDLVMSVLALGMVALLVYFLRPTKVGRGSADFRIVVEAGEVQFKGRFPANLQMLVEQFLVEDCQIPGRYEVLGSWEEGRLQIAVRGEQAKMQEQRIRNFLKLHVKRSA